MSRGAGGSNRTVLIALTINMLIAAAKGAAGLLSGSGAMLSEAAHSVADTLNETFLFIALRRSGRPADDQHPFGYGKERFFWSLLLHQLTGNGLFDGIASLLIGAMLVGTAVVLGRDSMGLLIGESATPAVR